MLLSSPSLNGLASASATSCRLRLDNKLFTGWKQIEIQTSMDQLDGGFRLVCADRWALTGSGIPAEPGAPCSIEIYDHPVITGFLDDAAPAFDARSHDLEFTGGDLTADLVDSAALVDGQGWKDRTLMQVAEALCAPFGITVTLDGDSGPAYKAGIFDKSRKILARNPFRSAHVNPGETVAETLQRAAQLRGYVLISDGRGGLRITRSGAGGRCRTIIEEGVNLLGGRGSNSQRHRFYQYDVIGQSNEFFGFSGPAAQQILGQSFDSSIRKSRRTVVHACDDIDAGSATDYANWANANRLARSKRWQLMVRGWLDGDQPWRLNTLVPVRSAKLRMSGTYLVAGVMYQLDSQAGEITLLTVTPVEAYVPAPADESLQ